MRLIRILLTAILIGLLASAALLFSRFFVGVYWPHTERLMGMLMLLAGFAAIGLGQARTRMRGKLPRLMTAGLVLTAAGWLGWVGAIWWPHEDDSSRGLWTWFAAPATAAAIAIMVIGLLAALRVRPRWAIWARYAANVLVVLLAIEAAAAVCWLEVLARSEDWRRFHEFEEDAWRWRGALGILLGVAIIAVVLGSRMADLAGSAVTDERLVFRVICPRCALRQTLRTGGDACGSCGLRIKVEPT